MIEQPPAESLRGPHGYPWSEWTNGQWWQANKGEDYIGRSSTFRSGLYVWAMRNGYSARTVMGPDWVKFSLTPKPQPAGYPGVVFPPGHPANDR